VCLEGGKEGGAIAWRLLWRRGEGRQGERDRRWRMTWDLGREGRGLVRQDFVYLPEDDTYRDTPKGLCGLRQPCIAAIIPEYRDTTNMPKEVCKPGMARPHKFG